MATPNVYRMTLTWSLGLQFAQSIFHWEFDDSGFATTQGAADALITAWGTAYIPSFAGFYPADTALLSLKARLVTAPGGFEAFEPVAPPLAGTRAGTLPTSAPSPVAIFYPLDTSRKRGRWFIPGVSDTDLTDGKFTAAYITAIDTLLGTQFDDISLVGGGAPTAKFVIYDRKDKTWFSPVFNKLSDHVGTLRRRQRPV
jgi:hypothetical protein